MTQRQKSEFASYVVDSMQLIGPVEAKRMFGGYGIFLGGLMFALIADDGLYLKVDDSSEQTFIDNGLEPFMYNKNGKQVKMSYYQAPAEALEDVDIMTDWANKAYEAAVRANNSKPKSQRK